ncbi:MAG: CRISPR-associated endoribonuclease Cas6 [Siphonobacter aquaeclarae]|nr:CRISPR-associated endoribonuclease Cas6 [Siphonobacter aquaeclarae]
MKVLLTFRPETAGSVIPINYQYELSAWIYRVIARADQDYATFLHELGFRTGKKSFKFFTFSQLDVPRRAVEGDRLRILSDTVRLKISFLLDAAAEQFIIGLFKGQRMELADRKSRAAFQVAQVDVLAPAPAVSELHLRTLSPLVIGRKNTLGHDDYLSPDEDDFPKLLIENLKDKYKAAYPESVVPVEEIRFRLVRLHQRPTKLITIKAGMPEETRVRGYLLDFELSGPSEVLEVGLLAGFGKYCSQGFGMAE